MSYDNGTFARNLKIERARRGWNQRDLADAAGIGFNTVARYEMGVHTPGLDNALALARALETSIDALVGWDPPDRREGQTLLGVSDDRKTVA